MRSASTPERLAPQRFPELLALGLGLTDLNKTEVGSDHELTPEAMDAQSLHAKLRQFRPAAIAFTSKNAASLALGIKTPAYGRQVAPSRRRRRLRAGLAVGPGPLLLDAGALAGSGRFCRRTATTFTRARGLMIGRRATLGGLIGFPALAQAQEATTTLRELARRATIYLFPVYEMYRARWRATVDEGNPQRQRLNRFRHVPTLADPTTRDVTTPNADTLYSSAWLDLSLEPLFLTVPPVGDLYYSYAFIDLFTDNFLVVSHRLKTNGRATHMIVGPNWKGDAASDVTLVRAPTTSVWLLGRILVDSPEELARVRILQSRVLLETPDMRNERRILETGELMRFRTQAPPEPAADWPAAHPSEPFDLFDIGMRALGESPLPERDRPLFEALAPLKLKPGRKFDQRAFSDAERRSIRAGIEQGHADIRAAAARGGRTIDGWTYGERHLGNFGDDYLYRAATALTALGALMPGEAVYVSCAVDAERRPLTGAARYTLTFPADGLPPRARLLVGVGLRDHAGRARFLQRQSDRPLFDRRPDAGTDARCRRLAHDPYPARATTGRARFELAARAHGTDAAGAARLPGRRSPDRRPLPGARGAPQLLALKALLLRTSRAYPANKQEPT